MVKVDDLDLATDSGIRVANVRVDDATRKACHFATASGDYVVGCAEVYRACAGRTMAAVDGQPEKLRLAALPHSGTHVAGNEAAERTLPARKVSGSP